MKIDRIACGHGIHQRHQPRAQASAVDGEHPLHQQQGPNTSHNDQILTRIYRRSVRVMQGDFGSLHKAFCQHPAGCNSSIDQDQDQHQLFRCTFGVQNLEVHISVLACRSTLREGLAPTTGLCTLTSCNDLAPDKLRTRIGTNRYQRVPKHPCIAGDWLVKFPCQYQQIPIHTKTLQNMFIKAA